MAHRADPLSGRPPARWALLSALAVAEIVWLAWFLTVPLPNAGKDLARWKLALIALPGISFGPSILGGGIARLSHFEYLGQRLPILLSAGLIIAAAIALGLLVLRGLRLRDPLGRGERLALAFGLGVALLGTLTQVAGRLGGLSPWSVRVALGLAIVIELALRWRGGRSGPRDRVSRSWGLYLGCAVVVGPFLLSGLLAAMLPTIDFDALEYHLQGPKEYFLAGRIQFLPHNVYTSMPFGVEMLHLLGMEVIGDWWLGALVGQVVVWAHAPAAALLIAATTRRWATPRAAWVAAVVYLTTPWIYRIAVLPYVEGPLCFYHAALIWVTARAWSAEESERCRFAVVVGLLAGGAFACKYPALISAVIPCGLFSLVAALRRRSPMLLVAFGIGTLAITGIWLLKNAIDHGNPVYPLANQVFGGHPWSPGREAQWAAAHGPKSITRAELVQAIVDVAGRSDWQSALYLALAPLSLLRPGSRQQAMALWGYVAYIFLTWWLFTHRLDRFWLPLLPGLAVLAGLGADWIRSYAWSALLGLILASGIFLGLVHSWTDLTALNDWTGDLRALRSGVPRMLNRPLSDFDATLPPDARPLLVGQAAVFHMSHPVVFNTVFDDEIVETIARDRTPVEVGRELSRRGITHIYVDWKEIERHRKPGGYGFTPFVTPSVFAQLVDAGVLEPPIAFGESQSSYRVRNGNAPTR